MEEKFAGNFVKFGNNTENLSSPLWYILVKLFDLRKGRNKKWVISIPFPLPSGMQAFTVIKQLLKTNSGKKRVLRNNFVSKNGKDEKHQPKKTLYSPLKHKMGNIEDKIVQGRSNSFYTFFCFVNLQTFLIHLLVKYLK
jgi:hypothetical protein